MWLFGTDGFSTGPSPTGRGGPSRRIGGAEAIAVRSLAFAEKVKSELGIKAMHRELEQAAGTYTLRVSSEALRRRVCPGK
jgi:hypothetical protein